MAARKMPVEQNSSVLQTERRSLQIDGSTQAICEFHLGVAKSSGRLPCGREIDSERHLDFKDPRRLKPKANEAINELAPFL
jgi:hypothetical protein